jgi:Na+/proline symporter
MATPYKDSLLSIKYRFEEKQMNQQANSQLYVIKKQDQYKDSIAAGNAELNQLKSSYKSIIKKAVPGGDVNDTNYIFLRFVVDFLPAGLVGLLIAIIFLAAWGSIAAALNSLASCTMVDFHCRFSKPDHAEDEIQKDAREYKISRYYTFAWGIFCVITAQFASGMGSLIEAVNVLGSLFYGVILGIFLVAFYMKKIQGNAVFWAAVVGEIFVIALFLLDKYNIIGLGFLWLNVAGALAVVFLGWCFSFFRR